MERFSNNKDQQVLLGYLPRNSLGSPKNTSRTSNSNVDFNDVFGGPPRRSSTRDWRHSTGEEEQTITTVVSRDPWSGLNEKLVFGDENVNPRRYPTEDFFDDIFKGDSANSTPRKSSHNLFSSSPRARLPSKMGKEVDFQAYNTKESSSNGLGFPTSASTSISKVRTLVVQVEEDGSRSDSRPSYGQSLLSHQHSFHEESPSDSKFENKDAEDSWKKVSRVSEVDNIGSQFHFSIYKWAGKGVPLALPFRGRNDLSTKERNTSESIGSELPSPVLQGVEFSSLSDSISTVDVSFPRDLENQETKSVYSIKRSPEIVTVPPNSQSAPKVPIGLLSQKLGTEIKYSPGAAAGIRLLEVTEKETPICNQEAQKTELQPLHCLLKDEIDPQDVGKVKTTELSRVKEEAVKSSKPARDADDSKKVKKQSGKRNTEAIKSSIQDSPVTSEPKLVKNKVKGKLVDFVKIFNQETPIKPVPSSESQCDKTGAEDFSSCKLEDQASIRATKADQKENVVDAKNCRRLAKDPLREDQVVKPLKPPILVNAIAHKVSDTSSETKDTTTSSSSGPVPETIAADVGAKHTSHGADLNFQVKELCHDQSKEPKVNENQEELHVSDAKVRQWSKGKEGNIRSLLSTLQYVLWPGSGWKPVPLVDIIEGNSVKRAYQKALLCLHPDKLQQKGAAAHQKYIAEKVFDILQESWIEFNSLGSF
ncbi:hypothetical protein GIB67_005468 [Kingdonia uniflora]|uniref:J domain-containing protein required for chloroplast accumulation response 1 n=1 Tax=Kingdonia uniflora TaxID=39325 RepID=A0A7J7NHD9_9MAGN|nr:hypothetical protein GIB67_005468 [Kingdonia uniflora]